MRMPAYPGRTCPACGAGADSWTSASAGDASPRAGDMNVCLTCGGLLVFADNAGTLRLPTPAEAAEAERLPDVHKARMIVELARLRS